jgi:hypothetical protein
MVSTVELVLGFIAMALLVAALPIAACTTVLKRVISLGSTSSSKTKNPENPVFAGPADF